MSSTLLVAALLTGLFATLLYILCSISTTVQYYVRMTLVYFFILFAAFISCFGSIPTYFFNQGGLVALGSLKLLCRAFLDVEFEVRGEEKISKASGPENKPLVLISNHQSSLDICVMAIMFPKKCTAMIKNSLKYVPFFNISAILCNAVFVNRYDKNSAQLAIKQAGDQMRKKSIKIWVFPEGTRHRGHGMLPFKKGAFNIAVDAQFDIVPVVISDYEPFYSKAKRYFRPNGKIIVQVMDPISTVGKTMDEVSTLCEQARSQMMEVYDKISEEAKQQFEEANSRRKAEECKKKEE